MSLVVLEELQSDSRVYQFQIGLVEKEWLDTLSTINPEEVTYTDYVESGNALAKELRGKGCQFIIALTHMRTPNDLRLAANAPEIDLILGGHDHVYEKKDVRRKEIYFWKMTVEMIMMTIYQCTSCFR